MGGGGQSGEISFPDYLEDIHDNWIRHNPYGGEGDDEVDYSIIDLMNDSMGVGGNPFTGESPFDPSAVVSLTDGSPLDLMRDEMTSLSTLLGAIDPDGDFADFVGAAADEYDQFADIDFLDNLSTAISGLLSALDTILDGANITALVQDFQTNKENRFLRDVSLWSAGMADGNSVHTSSFIIGLALMQMDFANEVDQYEKELKYNIYNKIVSDCIQKYLQAQLIRVQNKDAFLTQGAQIQAQLTQVKAQLTLHFTSLRATIENIIIGNMREKEARELAIDVDEATWNYKVYQFGANLLASISGAAGYVPPAQSISDTQATLGGATTGASIGAEVGGWQGAVVGGAVGGLAAYFLNQ